MNLSEAKSSDPHPASKALLDGSVTTGDVDRPSGINAVIAQTSRHRVDAIRRLDVKSGIHGVLGIAHMLRLATGPPKPMKGSTRTRPASIWTPLTDTTSGATGSTFHRVP